MNKIFVPFMIVILGAGVLFAFRNSAKNTSVDSQVPPNVVTEKNDEAVMQGVNRYVHYSRENLEQAADTRRVLFFLCKLVSSVQTC